MCLITDQCPTGCVKADLGGALANFAMIMSGRATEDLSEASTQLPDLKCPSLNFGKSKI